MAAVARHHIPTTTNPGGSLHLAAAPDAMVSQQQHGGVKALIAAHNSQLESSQRTGAAIAQKRSVSVSNGYSPPPPPPPARTSSRNAKLPYKEDVVIRDRSPSNSPSRAVRSNSVDTMAREGSVERGKLSSASEAMTGEENEERSHYQRQRSRTESSPLHQGGKNRFNTIQWRGDVKYNPYTGATAQSLHGKFSSSQPHLDMEGLIAPNDRIKKSMFEPAGLATEEEEEGMGEDYGSGYRSTLMKISHGDIQKHTVAVTTPIVPPPARFGSDPNILESQLDRAGMRRGKTNVPGGVPTDDSTRKSPSRREDTLSGGGAQVGVAQVADSGIPTTPIARAYREHLMEKMEKKKHKKLGSSGSSSASPSPSISSAESSVQPQGGGDNLSAKLRSITPSQLQGIDVPDRAYYPKILPPANTGSDKRQEHQSELAHNEGNTHNPFLLHSSCPVTSYDVPDTATYDALARKKPDMNQVQVGNMSGLKGATQPHNEFHSAPTSHALQQQGQEWTRTDDLTKSLGSVEQKLYQSQASTPANQPRLPQHFSTGRSGLMNHGNETSASYRPPVLPKPASKKNGSSLTAPPINHRVIERAMSDPSQQQGRGKPRLQGQQSLLEIQEADEEEERDRRVRSGPTFADYVTVNAFSFPKRVRLGQDFRTGSKDVMLSKGDEFDLHFVRRVKSVLMRDSTGVNYTAPLASIAKFSPIYDPFGSEKAAMQGFHFKSAGVLMDLKNRPSVVAATQFCSGGQAESSVEEGEVLVLQGIKNGFHGRLLKVFSLKYHIMKFLDEECHGQFSTSPDKLEMSLTQIYETSIPLPLKARFNSTSSVLGSVNTSVQSEVAILKQFLIAKSVIATTQNSVGSPSLSFSLDLDISVHEVPTPETRVVQMRKNTQSLVNNFGKGPLTQYIDMPTTASYKAQCALLSNLDPNSETNNSEILPPKGVMVPKRRSKTSPAHMTALNTQISTSDANSKSEHRIKVLEDKYSALESKVQEAYRTLDRVSLKVDQVHTYLTKAQNAMDKHKKQLDSERKTSQSRNSTSTSQSSISGDITGSKVLASNSASVNTSRESSFSLPNSGLGLTRKLSSESESVDGGSDRRSLNDDVFMRTNSVSKPPVLPKPKTFTPQKQNKTETRSSYVADAKRRLSLGESTNQAVDGSQGHPRTTEAKMKTVTREVCHPPLDSYPTVDEARNRLSSGESNRQSRESTPHVVHVAKRIPDDNPPARQVTATESKKSAPTRKEPIPTPAKATEGDSLDLKAYLLDSTHKNNTNGTSKTTPIVATPTSTKDTAGLESMSIEALTADLTDWCTQVEDELTQMYNDSILAAS